MRVRCLCLFGTSFRQHFERVIAQIFDDSNMIENGGKQLLSPVILLRLDVCAARRHFCVGTGQVLRPSFLSSFIQFPAPIGSTTDF